MGRYFHYLTCFAVRLFMFTSHFTSIIMMATVFRYYFQEHWIGLSLSSLSSSLAALGCLRTQPHKSSSSVCQNLGQSLFTRSPGFLPVLRSRAENTEERPKTLGFWQCPITCQETICFCVLCRHIPSTFTFIILLLPPGPQFFSPVKWYKHTYSSFIHL